MEGNSEKGKKAPTPVSSQDSSAICNPSKLAFKAYYFFFYSATGSSIPYLMLYFKQLGLNATQAGILSGVRQFSECIGAPLWGIIGDKFKMRKIILFAALASFATGTLLFMAFQPRNQECIETTGNKTDIRTPLIFTSGEIKLGHEKNHENDIQDVTSDRFHNSSSQPIFTRQIDESEMTKIFAIFLVIVLSSQIIGSTIFSMPDALVVGYLKEDVLAFGYYRSWGEVGVAAGSFIVGQVINFYQSEVCGEIVKNYFVSFYFFAGFISLAMFTVVFLKATYPDGDANDANLLPLVKELLKFHNAMFVVVACYLGILAGLHEYFGLWYLDDLGAEPYMLGLASGLRYTIAICGYTFSGIVIDKIGYTCTIAGCLLLYTAVYMGLAFVLNPWLGVVLFCAQGLLYGMSWSACVVFGGTVSERVGFHSATQGVLGGCYWGLGVGTGVFVSGVLINLLGVAKTYFVYSLTTLVVLAPFVIANFLKRSKEDRGDSDQGYKLVSTITEENQ